MLARFPSPFEIQTPPGAEGWEQLYLYSSLFSQDRRDYEDAGFWFRDRVHWPEVLSPWDATLYEFALASLSQYNTRHYMIPAARGVDFRILNGYAYLSPVGITNPAEIEARVPQFLERAGFYFQNWVRLYGDWLVKVRALVAEMDGIEIGPLPDKEPAGVITGGRGTGSGLTLHESYHKICDLALRLWQYHFEFLNLGYAAYLDFFAFCRDASPSIPDLGIATMVADIETDLFRPDPGAEEAGPARRRVRGRWIVRGREPGRHPRDAARHLGRPGPGWRGGVRPTTLGSTSPGLGLVPHRPDLDRRPRHPVRVHPRLHRQS